MCRECRMYKFVTEDEWGERRDEWTNYGDGNKCLSTVNINQFMVPPPGFTYIIIQAVSRYSDLKRKTNCEFK